MVYELNKKAEIRIKTPVGITDPIHVQEITKQGTLYGPVLCNINTDKVNKVGFKNVSTIGPNIQCEASIYVDDIEQAGSHIKTMERTAGNCGVMEDSRKFIFNNKVDKTAFMIIHPKKESRDVQKLKTQVKRGEIERTKEYKFLGEWYTEKGNHERSMQVKESKCPGMIAQTKFYGDPYRVGGMALQVRIQIYLSTIIQTVYHNVEAWSKITNKEVERLEMIQRDILTSILEVPKSTPYLGVLSELGVWPFEQLYEYKKIMLFHQIITSRGTRFLKEIIDDQVEDTWPGCWTEGAAEICQKYNLTIVLMKCLKKEKLKSILKRRINSRLDLRILTESKIKTKLRFLSNFGRKRYTEMGRYDFNITKNIMKLRLNMIEVKCNYKGQNNGEVCGLCGVERDTTEHLFECEVIKNRVGGTPNVEILKRDDEESYEELAELLGGWWSLR